METLYHISKLYFGARKAAKSFTDSPFIRAAALLALAWLAFTGLSGAPSCPRCVQAEEQTKAPKEAQAEANETKRPALLGFTPTAPTAFAPGALQEDGAELLAWWVLTAPTPGASGKAKAFEHLHRAGADFTNIDLSCARVSGAEGPCAKGARLSNVDLRPHEGAAANLRGGRFSGAALDGAKLLSAVLEKSDFANADLSKADLSRVQAQSAVFDKATLRGAKFTAADLTEARLRGADLRALDANMAILLRADLTDADLRKADFSDADLSGADLTGARLTGASLQGARLNLATLQDVEISGANFLGVSDFKTTYSKGLWAWADTPPINPPKELRFTLCAPGEDDANRRAHRIARKSGAVGRPKGC